MSFGNKEEEIYHPNLIQIIKKSRRIKYNKFRENFTDYFSK
jgi:hypothetical protein